MRDLDHTRRTAGNFRRGHRTKGWGTAAVLAAAVACSEPPEVPLYQLVPISVRDIVVSVSAAGATEPIQMVEVKSKASGEITEVLVNVGDVVRQGQVLVRVDQRIPRNAVMEAEADSVVAIAQLGNAESQLRRAETLFESQSITEQEFEGAKLGHANAYASVIRARRALEDARIAFEDTEVRAASAGVILAKQVEVGSVITSASRDVAGGAVLLRMANLDTVQVRTLVDETDVGKIQAGMEVTIHVDAYPNRRFEGRVLTIEPEGLAQQNVTVFPVLIRIANPDGLLRPGMTAEVEVHIGSVNRTLAVPNAALRRDRDLPGAALVLDVPIDTIEAHLTLDEGDNGDTHAGSTRRARPDRAGFRDRGSTRSAGSPSGNRYIVFVRRDGAFQTVPVVGGLTDLDYTAVLAGNLLETDSVYVLPSPGFIEELERRQNRMLERQTGSPFSTGRRGRR